MLAQGVAVGLARAVDDEADRRHRALASTPLAPASTRSMAISQRRSEKMPSVLVAISALPLERQPGEILGTHAHRLVVAPLG